MEQILRLFPIRIREYFLETDIFEKFSGELDGNSSTGESTDRTGHCKRSVFFEEWYVGKITGQAVPIGNGRRSTADEYADVTVFSLCL